MNKWHIINWLCMLIILPMAICGTCNYMSSAQDNGIHAHDSGRAVYIEEEGCTINNTRDIDLIHFQELYIWCSVRHMEYLREQD